MNPPDHTKFLASWVGILSVVAMGLGGLLLYKGFQGGELLIGAAISGMGGLVGIIQPRRSMQSGPGDTNVAGDATITTPAAPAQPQQQPPIKTA